MTNYKQRIMKQRQIIELYHRLIQDYISGYAELFGDLDDDLDEHFDDDLLYESINKAVYIIDKIIEEYLNNKYKCVYHCGPDEWNISDNFNVRKENIYDDTYYVLYHRQSGQKKCVIHISQIQIIIQFDEPKYSGLTKKNCESDEYKDLKQFFYGIDKDRRDLDDGYYDPSFRAETANYDFMDEGKQ